MKKAKELAKGKEDALSIVKSIYHYVVKNIKYDDDKAKNVQKGYLPSVDETLETKKGICFDYAALMTASSDRREFRRSLRLGILAVSIMLGSVRGLMKKAG